MKTYDVTIHTVDVTVVQIEANSKQEAKAEVLKGFGEEILKDEAAFEKCHNVEEVHQDG